MKTILAFLLVTFLLPIQTLAATAQHHSGKIYLQVEANGEAWYVNPDDMKRYFLGRPGDAFELMRSLGLGISNDNIRQIPVALDATTGIDSDNDGLSDLLEDALGTDKNNVDTDNDGFLDKAELETGYDPSLADTLLPIRPLNAALAGKILLQVEQNGEAWYVNPTDGKRYFLGRPGDAFAVMRSVGVGITNGNLATIDIATESQNQVEAAGCGAALMSEYDKEERDPALMLANRQEFKAVYDCLTESYKNCVITSGTLNQNLFTVEYDIKGVKHGLCDVEVTYSSKIVEDYNGKSMICHLDNESGHTLFVEVVNYPQCEGPLLDLLYPSVINNYRIISSGEGMIYTDQEIRWSIDVTTSSSNGEGHSSTNFVINDDEFKMHLSGESKF